jgi:hypothetical protein
MQVLAGFIDTDGSLHCKSFDIIQCIKNERVFDDIKLLAESLGFKMTKTQCYKTCKHKGVTKEFPCVRGYLSGATHIIPVRIPRKKPPVGQKRCHLSSFKVIVK